MRWVDPKGAQDNNMLAYQSVHTSRALTHCSSRGGVVVLSRILFLAPDLCTTTTSLPRDILIILNFNDSSWLASTFGSYLTKCIYILYKRTVVFCTRARPSNDTSRLLSPMPRKARDENRKLKRADGPNLHGKMIEFDPSR